MGILKKLILSIMPFILAGCYECFEPKIDTKPVLCINSLITAGENIDVSVSRTWLYTDAGASGNHQVNDATIAIYANGRQVSSDYLPQEGDIIKINVESPTYGKAEAEVQVPVHIPVESLEWHANVTYVWIDRIPGWNILADMSFNLNAALTIKDQASTSDFFKLSYMAFPEDTEYARDGVYENNSMSFYAGRLISESEPIFSEHIGVLDALNGSDSDGFMFFTDRQFSGKTYTLNLQFENCRYIVRDEDTDEGLFDCGIVFSLNTISGSYYNWCNYQWNIDNGVIGDFGDMGLGNPIWGYSNVSTGAGVVAAQSCATYTLNLKEFLEKELTSPN